LEGGGGTEGSLNCPGGTGLKCGTQGRTAGPDDENGVEAKGGAGGVGRKEGGSNPTMAPPVGAKGVTPCAAAAKGGLEG